MMTLGPRPTSRRSHGAAVLMMVGVVVAACNSPLFARRDGGWSGDGRVEAGVGVIAADALTDFGASPDLFPDQPSSPDLATDVGPSPADHGPPFADAVVASDLPDAPADGDAATVDAPPSDASSDEAGVDAGCIIAPIDEARATEIYTNLKFQNAPASIPDFVITATEKSVPGLWDTLQAQLFNGKVESKSGSYAGECSFLYRHCTVTLTSDNCNMFGPIESGLVANGAFYYSSPWGSGISYTVLDKLAPDGDTWVLTQSQSYYNPSHNPPGLVVAPGDGKILVYRATVYWEKFNEWLNPELIGTLKDFGDRLGILDADGNELGPQLP